MNAMHREALERLAKELPAKLSPDQTIEDQARAVLGEFIRQVLQNESVIEARPDDPTTCPNCGATTDSTRSPYCGDECREISGFVRQVRAGLAEETIFNQDRQVAFGQILWYLLGGGRPLRRHITPERAKLQVLKRENNICQGCGGEATTIDHLGTGCNRPINLRAVCEACCRDREFGTPEVVQRPSYAALQRELLARIGSGEPQRLCDDATTWDWRAYVNVRKATLSNR